VGIFGVVFVVLMILWLVLGCWVGYGDGSPANFRPIVGNTLIPWVCVAILGYIVLGGPSGGGFR